MNEVAPVHWSPLRSPHARPLEVKSLQDNRTSDSPLRLRMLAGDYATRTSTPRHGNADASIMPGTDTPRPRYKRGYTQDHGRYADRRENARGKAEMAQTHHQDRRRWRSDSVLSDEGHAGDQRSAGSTDSKKTHAASRDTPS